VCPARSTVSPRPCVLSWTCTPVQSFSPLRYHPYVLDDPAPPFRSADLAVFSRRASPFRDLAFRALLSSGCAVLQSFPRTTLAHICIYSAGSSPGLCLPTAHAETRVHTHGLLHPFRSAFRVWSPSWRFPPRGSLPDLFHSGSAPGIRPSKLSPRPGYRRVPTTMAPRAVRCLAAFPGGRSPAGKASCVGFWDFTPGQVPRRVTGKRPLLAGCSLGLSALLGVLLPRP
jgi:hypothetical protein